jgi:hypothetical protein
MFDKFSPEPNIPLVRSKFTRRRFLRGVGAAMTLPLFESSILPLRAIASSATNRLATTATGMPIRMGFMYHPNGCNMKAWLPTGEGKDFELGRTHAPLAAFKDKLQVIANLDQLNATAGPDGGGDHARGPGVWLTGLRINKSESEIRANTSIDQLAAAHVGKQTRFPSLELISDGSRKTGNCDSGYSCEYEFNISWRSPTTPNQPEPNPRLVFERLFGHGTPEERQKNLAARQERRRSVLDFVLDDAKSLSAELGANDQRKLDEYLYSVRDVEQRISRVEQMGHVPDLSVEAPAGMPGDFGERIDIMLEMMRLAFMTDSTRISTMIMARDGDDRVYTWLGHTGGHHPMSHYMNNESKTGNTPEQNLECLHQIEHWYMQRLAKFIQKMEETKDADGSSLLDNSMIMYGAGNADSNRHSHNNLPTILIGRGGGTLNTGRFVNAAPGLDPRAAAPGRGGNGTVPRDKGVPMCNYFLGLLEKVGVEGIDQFGDSTGIYRDI